MDPSNFLLANNCSFLPHPTFTVSDNINCLNSFHIVIPGGEQQNWPEVYKQKGREEKQTAWVIHHLDNKFGFTSSIGGWGWR